MGKPAEHTERAKVLLAQHPPKKVREMLIEEDAGSPSMSSLYDLKWRMQTGQTAAPAGISRTNVDASALVRPEWKVRGVHQQQMNVIMLRHLARRMAGMPLGATQEIHARMSAELDRWITKLVMADQVIDYQPNDGGFVKVPRRYWRPAPNVQRPLDEWIRDPLRNDDGMYVNDCDA